MNEYDDPPEEAPPSSIDWELHRAKSRVDTAFIWLFMAIVVLLVVAVLLHELR